MRMTERDDLVLEHLTAIRRQVEEIGRTLDCVADRIGSMAEATQMDRIGIKLDGLTFVVQSSFEALVNRLVSLDQRLARLQREQT
jgi:hypothetical protein